MAPFHPSTSRRKQFKANHCAKGFCCDQKLYKNKSLLINIWEPRLLMQQVESNLLEILNFKDPIKKSDRNRIVFSLIIKIPR